MNSLIALGFGCAVVAAGAAHAAEFRKLDVAASHVRFTSRQMGVPVDGRFRKFDSTVAIDPAAPEATRGRVEIDLASIDTGLKEANEEVMGPSWFDVKRHPKATFEVQQVEPIGPGRFQVSGLLGIRGVSQDATFAARLQSNAERAVLEGDVPLKRLAYGIGQGGWGSTDVVADEVIVRFKLVLTP